MCQSDAHRVAAWQGWKPMPAPAIGAGGGPWHDLTHRLTEDLARSPIFPRPRIERIFSQPHYPGNATELQMVCHHGTHVDAPRHFFLDGPGFDEIPLERLYGPGVVLRIEAEADQPITAETLARFDDQILPGDIVLLDTDWARRVADEAYENHPYLTADAAEWLLDRGIRMLGVDFSTPDLGARLRPAGFDYPVHKILLGHGILIAEHLANLRPLAGHRIEAMLLGLPVAGSDGGPARAVARLA